MHTYIQVMIAVLFRRENVTNLISQPVQSIICNIFQET